MSKDDRDTRKNKHKERLCYTGRTTDTHRAHDKLQDKYTDKKHGCITVKMHKKGTIADQTYQWKKRKTGIYNSLYRLNFMTTQEDLQEFNILLFQHTSINKNTEDD